MILKFYIFYHFIAWFIGVIKDERGSGMTNAVQTFFYIEFLKLVPESKYPNLKKAACRLLCTLQWSLWSLDMVHSWPINILQNFGAHVCPTLV